jgi:hypothetical protein
MVLFQKCVQHFDPSTKMAPTAELRLVGSRDHRTHILKGAIQGPFHQSLVAIDPVVSEEKSVMGISKNLLLNCWAILNQTLLKWSLGGPLPKVFPAFQTSEAPTSWLEVGITEHKFGRGPSKNHFSKIGWYWLSSFRREEHLNLLLWNRWTKLNQTWQGWSLGGSLSKLCPTAPPSIQDGHCY